jgi:signal transduction histidine kinase
MDQQDRRNKLSRYACFTMVLAAGVQGGYTAWFQPDKVAAIPYGAGIWGAAYAVFVAAYSMMPNDGPMAMTASRASLLTVQSLAGILLVWLYPSFIVSCLLVVVAWQFALLLDFRQAIAATAAQVIALTVIPCVEQPDAMVVLVLVSCAGFQLFALCAAQLARSEIAARDELARTNTELQAAYVLLGESARSAERLRIARDLHDTMGHTLTTLTIHLDVASRLTSGPAVEHLACARTASAELLDQVRLVVSRFRIQPTDLRAILEKLVESAQGLQVSLRMPPDLIVPDAVRAEAIVRCVQEILTNAMRHARARELTIDVHNAGGAIVITARDDGRGGQFTPGHGLAGMRERFEILGGSLSISSTDGEGFMVRGVLPPGGSVA